MAAQGASFINAFGEVYADRIAFNAKKGWFSGGVREELPIRHVTSVRVETSRSAVMGVLLVLVGLALFSAGGVGVLFGLLSAALGLLLLLGSPSITINTAGGDKRTSRGTPFQRSAGEEFAAAVRRSLFAE